MPSWFATMDSSTAGRGYPEDHAVNSRIIVRKGCAVEISVTRLNQPIAAVELGKAIAQYCELTPRVSLKIAEPVAPYRLPSEPTITPVSGLLPSAPKVKL